MAALLLEILQEKEGERMQKVWIDLETHTAIGCPPSARINSSRSIKKRNLFELPASMCEMLHKLNRLNKPHRLVDLFLQN